MGILGPGRDKKLHQRRRLHTEGSPNVHTRQKLDLLMAEMLAEQIQRAAVVGIAEPLPARNDDLTAPAVRSAVTERTSSGE